MTLEREIKVQIRDCKIAGGYANCHIPGVYSLLLRPRQDENEGALRMFYSSPESKLDQLYHDDDFVVMPHNHRQDITLYPLFGKATNVDVHLQDGPATLHEYEFKSLLVDGELSVKFRRSLIGGANITRWPIERDGVFLRWWHVHTVVAEPDTAWIVKEGRIAPDRFVPLAYSKKTDKKLDPTGLYRPMTLGELINICHRIEARLK